MLGAELNHCLMTSRILCVSFLLKCGNFKKNSLFLNESNHTSVSLIWVIFSASSRSWTYQTCNEFGFFQSTDVGENIFGGPIPVKLVESLCVFHPFEQTIKLLRNQCIIIRFCDQSNLLSTWSHSSIHLKSYCSDHKFLLSLRQTDGAERTATICIYYHYGTHHTTRKSSAKVYCHLNYGDQIEEIWWQLLTQVGFIHRLIRVLSVCNRERVLVARTLFISHSRHSDTGILLVC